jgi:hypothetical protein
MRLKRWMTGIFAVCAATSVPLAARADMVTYITPAGSMTSGGMVSAEADITTGAGTVTLILKDLVINPNSVAQNLSAFTITFSDSVGANSLFSSSSVERTVNSNGSFSDGGTVATGWAESSTTSTLKVDDLVGGVGPIHTLIGAPGSGGYTNAGGSIAGNGPHNPFLNQTATFTFNAAGVTFNTHITSATFQFGTTPGSDNVVGVVSAVPEPSVVSFAVVTLAVAGAGAHFRRRARRTTDQPAVDD